ncbi:MAG: hypothetical protein JNM90_11620 [Burkholderiales bacterium]|nr:hypothetical protein [Burkholderiales bacterium]
MLIVRWLLLLAGIGICASAALYLWTGRRVYLLIARRLFLGVAGLALLFFGILALERLA